MLPPCGSPLAESISYVGLLLAGTDGSLDPLAERRYIRFAGQSLQSASSSVHYALVKGGATYPLSEPETTKTFPLANVCSDGYQRFEFSLWPGSFHPCPSNAGFVEDLVRYRTPSKPSPTESSSQVSGPLPPTANISPFARKVPPAQKALVSRRSAPHRLGEKP